ncbi:MAG: peptidoglycan-binding protein [Oscillospiraceae bacterium]|nr:peptidoglycan-binding protein [Oscillospiraceae bacterium]
MTLRQGQLLLAYLGFYQGAIDGIWGPKSRAGAEAFQRRWGDLTVDGILGEQTREALRKAVAEGMPAGKEGDFWEGFRFFRREEFRCKCGQYCGGYPAEMAYDAVAVAERARVHFGRPGYVSSGLRCRQHNANCGGAEKSRHMAGLAVDLRIEGVSGDGLLAYLKQQPEVRYAYRIDESHVHFDVREVA